jgi:MarR family transcriptional regulator, organic hydroperoxide resistance regulator
VQLQEASSRDAANVQLSAKRVNHRTRHVLPMRNALDSQRSSRGRVNMRPVVRAKNNTPNDTQPVPALGDVLEFMSVLWQLDHALQRASKRMEVSLGVTGPQRLVMRIVGRIPGLPAGQLAKLLHLHPSTLTGILKRLEGQGLLRRRTDAQDGRRALFVLTEKGRSFDVATEGTVEACISRTLDHTPAPKLAAARALLEHIAAQLEETVARPVTAVKPGAGRGKKAQPRGRRIARGRHVR